MKFPKTSKEALFLAEETVNLDLIDAEQKSMLDYIIRKYGFVCKFKQNKNGTFCLINKHKFAKAIKSEFNN